MRTLIAALALLIPVPAFAQNEADTAAVLEAQCNSKSPTDLAQCTGKIEGFMAGYRMAFPDIILICPPVGIKMEDYITVLKNDFRDHPERRQARWSYTMLLSFNNAFTCPMNNIKVRMTENGNGITYSIPRR